MAQVKTYQEIVEFIASGPSPADVSNYRPNEEARECVWSLVQKEKQGALTAEERAELDHYVQLEHIMRMAKALAKRNLRSASSK